MLHHTRKASDTRLFNVQLLPSITLHHFWRDYHKIKLLTIRFRRFLEDWFQLFKVWCQQDKTQVERGTKTCICFKTVTCYSLSWFLLQSEQHGKYNDFEGTLTMADWNWCESLKDFWHICIYYIVLVCLSSFIISQLLFYGSFEPCIVIYLCNQNQQNTQFLH
jgi:hypothetical protein